MQIDLTKPYSEQDVAKLLASKDDSADRQLRVSSQGEAYLSDVVGKENTAGLAFRVETWNMGNEYVGVKAANDENWVKRIFNVLQENWPNPTSDYIDVY